MSSKLGLIAVVGLTISAVSLSAAAMVGGKELHDKYGDDFINKFLQNFDNDFVGQEPSSSQPGEKTWSWNGDSLEIDVPGIVRAITGAPAHITLKGEQKDENRQSTEITVRAPQDVLDRVRFDDGKLALAGHSRIMNQKQPTEINIEGKPMQSYTLRVGKLELGHVDQDDLTVRIAGAGEVSADGRTNDLTLNISGAGNARFGELVVKTADVKLSGAGNAEISASDEADITISGIGNVKLLTLPKKLTTHLSGLGHVEGPDGRDVSRGYE